MVKYSLTQRNDRGFSDEVLPKFPPNVLENRDKKIEDICNLEVTGLGIQQTVTLSPKPPEAAHLAGFLSFPGKSPNLL